MADRKRPKHGDLASLVRRASQENKAAESLTAEGEPGHRKIFSVLEYIESEWGLRTRLFPGQRFIVKLYYNLELDRHLPEDPNKRIQVPDPFTGKILYEFSEYDYLKFLHNEGRCNIGEQDHDRRELILAIGRRGGKCVEEGTLVPTSLGIFRVEELGEAPEEEFAPIQLGIAQEAGRRAEAQAFYNGGIKPTYLLRTHAGYEIAGTANHRVKVMSAAGRVEWRYLDEIRPGDVAAINRSADLWASAYLDVTPYHNDDGRKEVALPKILDERLGNLMGYLVGDGTWGDDQAVSVTVEHPETWGHLGDLFRGVFGEPRVQMDARTANTGRLEFCSVRARRFLDALGWKLRTERDAKMVPWAILRSPKRVVCAFLRGLFETDGGVEDGGRKVTFSSASSRLAHEVQTLLLNLGIVSRVCKKWNPKTQRHYAHLQLKGVRSRQVFAELVGFDSEKKRGPMLAALATAQEGKSDTESIPCQWGPVRDWLESVPKRNPARGEHGWGRSKLREALGNVHKSGGEDLTYSKLRRALGVVKELPVGAAETQHFEELLRLDYFYDPVVSVEERECQVYDLTVPDGEAFMANGFTNHNTTLSGIFASYEVYKLLNLYNPQAYYGLPNGNRIQIISVATDKEQAGLLFNEVTAHVAKCEYFKPYVANNTLSHVNFRTPYDIEKYGPTVRQDNGKFVSLNGKATLRVTFKSCIAKGLRGPGNIVIILDEVAHFIDKGSSSAEEIYEAVTPSSAMYSRKDPRTGRVAVNSLTGEKAPVESRIILISSPLGQSGKFYNQYDLAMRGGEGSKNLLAIQAPTWEINPNVPPEYFKQKYHANPTTFMVEFGAQFSDQVKGWIERKTDLYACIKADRRPTLRPVPRTPHQMGIDVGLVDDGTAVTITHVEDSRIVLDYHEIWYAGVSWHEANPHLDEPTTPYARDLTNVDRLDFDEIANWIQVLAKRFYITAGLFDRWNGIPLEQKLHKMGLRQFQSKPFSRDDSSKMYQTAKMIMYDEHLVLYDYPIPERGREGNQKHSPFIAELLSLQATQVSKNIVMVAAPQKAGLHDDQSDSFVRAVWLSAEALANQKHASHGGGVVRPHAAGTMNADRFQLTKMRKRGGGVGDRLSPRLGRSLVRSR